MKYSLMADAYEKIEAATKRLEMTDYLVAFLKKTPKAIIDKVAYLTQGKLYPDFMGIEIGIAEKMAIKAVARVTSIPEKEIEDDVSKTGDLGKTTQKYLKKKTQVTFFQEPLTVEKVYETFDKMAKSTGTGSMEQKINRLAGLLANATLKEAKYIIRMVTGKLRLGIADMTILDALAIAYGGGKETRDDLERAYNISSDLGKVAKAVAEMGINGIRKFGVKIGEPIRPMLAERLGSPEEILEKLGGRCIVEFKYDGERVQAHKKNGAVKLFSRRLENITHQFPDAVELIRTYVKPRKAIIEAEIVAIDPDTGEMRPFQELMHRRRKYGINHVLEEYPISLFVFDVLLIDDKDYTQRIYPIRNKSLNTIIRKSDRVRKAACIITDNPEEMEEFFEKAVASGCEGVICKSIKKDSIYQAGARGWLWIKYKRDYKSELTDTIDLAIVGVFHGRGKRGGTYGALLLAAYNSNNDVFETVTRCGTGFTDTDLERLPKMLEKYRLHRKSPRVNSTLKADIWFEPKVVIEVIGAEITISPIHTAGMDSIRKGSGLAIRFPRFTGNYRFDKSAEDATTIEEVIEMYKNQFKRVQT